MPSIAVVLAVTFYSSVIRSDRSALAANYPLTSLSFK
nr:MAG TPA: hypothetical protein [Caudoviricetes sp.]